MQGNSGPRLGDIVVAAGLVSREDVEACVRLQAERAPCPLLGEVLLERGLLTAADLERALALQREALEGRQDVLVIDAPGCTDEEDPRGWLDADEDAD